MDKGVEEQMVRRSLKAARRADVCLIVVDAEEGIAEQEGRLAQFVIDSGRACVLIVNKSAKRPLALTESLSNLHVRMTRATSEIDPGPQAAGHQQDLGNF